MRSMWWYIDQSISMANLDAYEAGRPETARREKDDANGSARR